MADSNREKSLNLALGTIEKAYGKGAIMRLGDAAARLKVPVTSSGAISLDLALGVGGYPRGRVDRDLRARSRAARRPSPSTRIAEVPEKSVAWRPSSMPSTPST